MGIYKRGATYTLKANLWKVNKLEVKQEMSWAGFYVFLYISMVQIGHMTQ